MIYSYSSISTYLTCPALFKAQYIDRTVKTVETPAMARGKRIHEALETSLRDRRPTPPPDARVKLPLWQYLITNNAIPELRLAVNQDYKPCDFFNHEARLRGVIDVFDSKGVMIDWKTGNPRYVDDLQAVVYSAMAYAIYGLRRSIFVYVFTTYNSTRFVTFGPDERFDGPKSLDYVASIIDTIEADKTFEPSKCWKCGRFCPNVTCPFNGDYER
jgi:hypothetical protein